MKVINNQLTFKCVLGQIKAIETKEKRRNLVDHFCSNLLRKAALFSFISSAEVFLGGGTTDDVIDEEDVPTSTSILIARAI